MYLPHRQFEILTPFLKREVWKDPEEFRDLKRGTVRVLGQFSKIKDFKKLLLTQILGRTVTLL